MSRGSYMRTRNSEGSSKLWIDIGDEEENLEDIVQSKGNSVESLVAARFINDFMTDAECVSRLINIVHKMPNLKEITLGSVRTTFRLSVSVLALARVLPKTLEKLELNAITLTGSQVCFNSFCEALSRCTKLNAFAVTAVVIEAGFEDAYQSNDPVLMTPLLSSFCHLPVLSYLSIYSMSFSEESYPAIVKYCEKKLGSSLALQATYTETSDGGYTEMSDGFLKQISGATSTLSRLLLREVAIGSHMDALLESLRANTHLQELILDANEKDSISWESTLKLIELLGEQPHLRRLDLSILGTSEPSYSLPDPEALQNAIHNLASLQAIRFLIHDRARSSLLECLPSIIGGLSGNDSLKTVEVLVWCYRNNDDGSIGGAVPADKMKELEESLASRNTTLHTLAVAKVAAYYGGFDADWRIVPVEDSQDKWRWRDLPVLSDGVEFWLRLNRQTERNKLLEHMDDQELWIDTLIEHKEDHSVVFYLLSTNPSLFYKLALSEVKGTNRAARAIGGKKRLRDL